jgi:hypothetical protein
MLCLSLRLLSLLGDKLLKSLFLPKCYHCGKIGHIQPNCFMLKPHEHVKDSLYSRNSHEGLFNMRVALTRLDDMKKQTIQSHKSSPRSRKFGFEKMMPLTH